MSYFNQALENKSKAAAFFLLLDYEKEMDKAKELERVRMLRLIAGSILEAKMYLVRHYVQGQYGGISPTMAQDYVRHCFQSSPPSRIHLTYSNGQTSDISRYILVDWLVEVLGMKEYSTHTLYLAVSMFDRFLQVRKIERSQLQLLGVAAMVISSRYLGFNILTIREAAWLTDNSYSYQDVVRMMGELVAALSGNLRVLNIHDFVMVLAPLVGETCQSAMLMEYLAMLCLLQSEMGQYSPSEIAASCLLLARLLLNHADPWPRSVQEWTGFTQDYLSLCAFHIYNKCLLEGSEVDYRDTKLQAVKTRYADPNRFSISKIQIIRHKELCKRLGVAKLVTRGRDTKAIKFRNTDELIMSPSRVQGEEFDPLAESFSFQFECPDRRLSATPPIDIDRAEEEPGSGYDGDQEDSSDESFLSKPDSELDLWDSTLEDSHDSDEENEEEEDEDEANKNSVSVNSITEHLKKFSSSDSCSQQPLNRVPCLSSMCQLGTKLSCHSAVSSSSSCVANCWCSQFVKGVGTFEVAAGSLSAPEMISVTKSSLPQDLSSSPSSSSSSSSSSSDRSQIQSPPSGASSMTSQNIRTCIPRGSIGKSKRYKLDKSSKSSDISAKQSTGHGSRRGQPLTRSKSLQSFSSCDSHSNPLTNSSSTVTASEGIHKDDEKNIRAYLLNIPQKNMCNRSDKFQVNDIKGSNAQDTVVCGDFLSTPSHSSSVSPPQVKILPSPSPSLSTPSLLTKSSEYSSENAKQACDISNTPSSSKSVPEAIEATQKALGFQSLDTFEESISFNQDKDMKERCVHSPVTPENSLDSFTTLSRNGDGQAMQQLLVSGRGINPPLGCVIKKARLDFGDCTVDGYQIKEPGMKCDSNSKSSPDSSGSISGYSSQSNSSKCPEVGPVLRRKRKCSGNKCTEKN
ncbi:cyclin-F-like [Elysia marginata]|uniref:Cyclin-F-like n=1 Tax=Elysia marginata TaxID=1093978 RepID=A0AAV4EDG2_9GAST|nr:cyclin-F-like [Elysia marginata]